MGSLSPISELRKASKPKMTQKGIADKIGCTEKTYRSWEQGSLPNTHDLIALANIFGVSTDYILGRTEFKRVEYKDVSKITGLSEDAIHAIIELQCADVVSALVTQPEFKEIASLLKRLLDKNGLDQTNTKNHVTGIWERGMHGNSYYSEDIGDSIKYRADTQFRYILDRIYQYWRENDG